MKTKNIKVWVCTLLSLASFLFVGCSQNIDSEVEEISMPEKATNIIVFLVLALWVLVAIRFVVKAVRNKYAPVKTAKAVVVDKHKVESFSKYSGDGKR